MSENAWVKLGSWHLLRGPHDHLGPFTRCGRSAEGLVHHAGFPGDQKSCESCLRMASKDGE